MAEYKGVLVIGEFAEGGLTATTRELLGGARGLADQMKEEVGLTLCGEKASSLAREGIVRGADKVYVAEHPIGNEFPGDAHTFFVSEVCRKTLPSLCLFGQTDLGRDVAPRVAARLEAGLCMDCVEVKMDTGSLLHIRPAYGGKAMAVLASARGRIQVDTIRAKSMVPLPPQEGRKGEIVNLSLDYDSSRMKTRLTRERKLPAEGVKLEEAKVIVAGGGGLGGPEGFERIKELALLLRGAVGATRVPVDEKWVPLSMEIGQTGKIVSPELYIAVGISGAAQHITGCLNSKKIVAINKDPDANIFKISDLGLVADYRVALPVLIQKLKTAS